MAIIPGILMRLKIPLRVKPTIIIKAKLNNIKSSLQNKKSQCSAVVFAEVISFKSGFSSS